MPRTRPFRLLSIVLMFATIASHPSLALAQETYGFPGAPLPDGVTLDFSTSGQFTESLGKSAHLILEHIVLAEGDSLQPEEGPQIVVNESGNLETIDDLGLTATLREGEQYFGINGAEVDLQATEPTTLLRARISVPTANLDQFRNLMQSNPSDILIYDNRCTPEAVELGDDGMLTIENTTNSSRLFEIPDLELQLRIQPRVRRTLDLSNAPDGHWTATCGTSMTTGISPRPITIYIGESAPSANAAPTVAAPTPTPSATPTPSPTAEASVEASTTVIFDLPLLDPQVSSLTFSFTQVTLTGATSLGQQAFAGQTAIYSTSQPLSIARPGYLTSTLPAKQAVLLPSDSLAEIVNGGAAQTSIYVISLAAGSGSSTSAGETTPEDRPPYRDPGSDAPSPTPSSSIGEPNAGATDLEAFLPEGVAMAQIGFQYFYSQPAASIDDSIFGGYAGTPGGPVWEAGVAAYYLDLSSSGLSVIIFVDRFASPSDASSVVEALQMGITIAGDTEVSPYSPNSDRIVAATAVLPESSTKASAVSGQYGAYVVTLIVSGSPDMDTAAPVYDIWDLIEATRA